MAKHGWEGWDQYAPFYDWENKRTLGRRDVPFWRRVASAVRGVVLELGCGTGRVSLPLVRAGVALVGVDRSRPMLERAARRASLLARPTRSRARFELGTAYASDVGWPARGSLELVRGDIRALPFAADHFAMVLAPYGVLQSLLRDRDLTDTIASVARVLRPGGTFGIDLVPDVPNWREYRNRVQLRGRAPGGARLRLVESVRQDRRRRLTTFEQCYVERRGGLTREHRFDLTFRTVSVPEMTRRLGRAGFRVEAVLGDYRDQPWDERAAVWIILATKRRS